ncbi:MAG: enoyl-CoA hydratase/isomerase family protein [Phycisphaerales bacterium]
MDTQHDPGVAIITLSDPERRNALSVAMFDGLDMALDQIETAEAGTIRCVLIRGAGPAFCAGFDLPAVLDAPALLGDFIQRLSTAIRRLRRLTQPVVAQVHGAAIAGGCAILSACDFVVIANDAKVGYPVHAIGISPAVTLPTLMGAIGAGPARALVMSGKLLNGSEAFQLGLATHCVNNEDDALHQVAHKLAIELAGKPPHAVQTTKRWLNQLDSSLDDDRFDGPASQSAAEADGVEAIEMLKAAWEQRR